MQKLTNKTGTLNTLNKVLLAEQVNDYQRQNDQQATGILNCVLIQSPTREGRIAKRFGDLAIKSIHGLNIRIHEELVHVELVGPLPREGEQEDSNHHRYGKRQDDLEEGAEGVGAVHVSGFFQLVGNTGKELTHHKDVKSVLEGKSEDGEKDQRHEGVNKLDTLGHSQHLKNTEVEVRDIKVSELHKH